VFLRAAFEPVVAQLQPFARSDYYELGCLEVASPNPLNMVTLLLSSRADDASMNLYGAVLALGGWSEGEEFGHGFVHFHSSQPVHLLLIDGLHINADEIDSAHSSAVDIDVEEVLVLSRHAAKSGIPALTVHAIGVPGEVPHGEVGYAGGRKGSAVPPSPRFTAIFLELQRSASLSGLAEEFDITLETTHHGPFLTKPTLYIEIGSTEKEWSRRDASKLWAEVISTVLGLDGSTGQGIWPGEGEVMIGLGGGHYAPRHTAVVNQGGFWMAHLLANYALEFDGPVEVGLPTGPWRHSVGEVVRKTREAFPGGVVFAHLDRKSFKGWQRRALISELDELAVPVRRGRDMFG
jgi:D-aminoacyl-tRNA deacylase